MSETKNPGEKLSVSSTKTLSLKRGGVEQGVVRQSFSHGRTKQVVVEKVKRRVGPGEPAAKPAEAAPAPAPAPERAPAGPSGRQAAARATSAAQTGGAAPKSSGVVLRTLTEEERSARAHALADARVREAEERKTAEEEARRRAERDAVEKKDRDAAEARKRDEEVRRKHDEETKRKADEVARKRLGGEEDKSAKPATTPGTPVARTLKPEAEEDERRAPRRGPGGGPARPVVPPKPTRPTPEKQRSRLTLVTAMTSGEERERSVAAFRRRVQRMTGHREVETKEKISREVVIPETITIQ
jgi:translation initiation factor IF-2